MKEIFGTDDPEVLKDPHRYAQNWDLFCDYFNIKRSLTSKERNRLFNKIEYYLPKDNLENIRNV